MSYNCVQKPLRNHHTKNVNINNEPNSLRHEMTLEVGTKEDSRIFWIIIIYV